MIEKFIEHINSTGINYLFIVGIAAVILTLMLTFRKKLASGILNFTSKAIFKRNEEQQAAVRTSLLKPLSWAFGILGFYIALRLLLGILFSAAIGKAFRIAVIVIITWMLMNYASMGLPIFFKFGKNVENRLNETAVKFLINIFKVVAAVFSIVIIISELGYNISGLITGVGLGGLTIALAAQDSASNLFGGFIIILDKPFEVGDWITTPDVDGVVEDITVRSTRIRSFADSVIVIPNATLANQAITNWSKMNKREVSFSIGLKYDTSNDLMQKCQEKIREYLVQNDNVEKEPIRVYFENFDSSSINIMIYYFTKAVDKDGYLQARSEINYKIKEIIESLGAEFAFPSRSIYVEGNK